MVDRAGSAPSRTRCSSASTSRWTPTRTSATCAWGQQQIVEIARALSEDARVLIMDEPTSALSVAEVEVLFRVIRDLTAAGVAIVYISHHLEEALEIADNVVVFRDGQLVAEAGPLR
jgi:erythritol transport system ATP-binding protein